MLESQRRFPDYVNARIKRDKSIPGQGFYKNYQSTLFNSLQAFDYLNAEGYVGFNVTKHIGVQVGQSKNFIGNGYRSLLLSDFANNYFSVKFNTRIWKFHYQNIFAEVAATSSRNNQGNELLPKKYFAAHYLNFKATPKLELGVYEVVVFHRNDIFEFYYLNPIIFYKTAEGGLDSPDNVIIGADIKWNFWKRFQLYGQMVLDEFKFDELFQNNRGWWANKYGFQAGLKYINAFSIDHLDLQVEYNTVRPYTYTHRDTAASYSHHNQPLAHPLGANFKEYIAKLNYQPIPKLRLNTRLIYANYGEDTATENWGNNVLLPHTTRVQDYGNTIGQGTASTSLLVGIDLSYELFHNGYIEFNYFYRNQVSTDPKRSLLTNYFGGGLRVNFVDRKNDF